MVLLLLTSNYHTTGSKAPVNPNPTLQYNQYGNKKLKDISKSIWHITIQGRHIHSTYIVWLFLDYLCFSMQSSKRRILIWVSLPCLLKMFWQHPSHRRSSEESLEQSLSLGSGTSKPCLREINWHPVPERDNRGTNKHSDYASVQFCKTYFHLEWINIFHETIYIAFTE